ncbi:hypothetical protein MLD38_036740 [Melastoma candidum]|uniref:Uncharacterized protein n=1 Tax=Melastoma candidum TaxID=119954 RepID=A0ACB9LLU4_9MYRT|nr:hypothetical protein MLD38_036740 [Melastoma candidum]
MPTTPIPDLDSVDNDHSDVNRFRTLDLLCNFIGAESTDSSLKALGKVFDDGSYGFLGRSPTRHVDIGDIDASYKLSLTNMEVNSIVGSSGFHGLAQTQNLQDDCGSLDGLHKMPLTTPVGKSNDGSSGFAGRVQIQKLGIDINAPVVSCELSLSIPGMIPNHGPSSSQSRVQNSRPGFEAMSASRDRSRTTSLGCRKGGSSPNLDQSLRPPDIITRTPKNKYFKSKQPHFDPPPYVLPDVFRQHIKSLGGQEVKLVTQKVLTCSDLSSHLARLLLPENQFVRGEHFLRPGELEYLRADKDNKIPVGVVSTRFEETTLKLKQWSMGKNRTATSQPEAATYYVILGGWAGFARENKLKENDRVQLWSFRVNNRDHHDSLKIAIVNIDCTLEDPKRE